MKTQNNRKSNRFNSPIKISGYIKGLSAVMVAMVIIFAALGGSYALFGSYKWLGAIILTAILGLMSYMIISFFNQVLINNRSVVRHSRNFYDKYPQRISYYKNIIDQKIIRLPVSKREYLI